MVEVQSSYCAVASSSCASFSPGLFNVHHVIKSERTSACNVSIQRQHTTAAAEPSRKGADAVSLLALPPPSSTRRGVGRARGEVGGPVCIFTRLIISEYSPQFLAMVKKAVKPAAIATDSTTMYPNISDHLLAAVLSRWLVGQYEYRGPSTYHSTEKAEERGPPRRATRCQMSKPRIKKRMVPQPLAKSRAQPCARTIAKIRTLVVDVYSTLT